MPAISVIVPVYKVEKYIHRCVDSILAQTFTDFELILVDDGSPDNCGAICDEYSEKDRRVIAIHQENGGLSAARNAGIDWAFANSDSQWISFIDSDDWVHPEYLERLWGAAVKHNVLISICGYAETTGDTPKIKESGLVPQIWNAEDFYVENNVNATIACGKLYLKHCFGAIRYPIGKIHEDEFVTYKILFANGKSAVIKEPLYMYFKNEAGITSSPWSINRLVILDACNEQIAFFKSNGYTKAYSYVVKRYFLLASCCIENVEKLDCGNKNEIIKRIKKGMRMLCYQNHGLPVYSQNLREWILAKMYPLTMRCYFIVKRIVKLR